MNTPDRPDYVQEEILAAFEADIPVIPVLIDNVQMPDATAMRSLGRLAYLQSVRVENGKDYDHHVERLARAIEKSLAVPKKCLAVLAAFVAVALLAGAALGRGLTEQGSGLAEQAKLVGLQGVENRNDPGQSLPPEDFFNKAKREVAVSGVSCFRTFDQHKALIEEMLKDKRELYFLIVDPDSQDMPSINKRHSKPIDAEIRQVLQTIRHNKFHTWSNFHIRMSTGLPPFTAVMIDGDISELALPADDRPGKLRVQPVRRTHRTEQGNHSHFRQDHRRTAGWVRLLCPGSPQAMESGKHFGREAAGRI